MKKLQSNYKSLIAKAIDGNILKMEAYIGDREQKAVFF